MRTKKSKVLTLLAAIGLLGAGTAAVNADVVHSPWQPSGVIANFSHAGLSVTYAVDRSILFPNTTSASNTTLLASGFFQPQQRCGDNSLKAGPLVSSAVFSSSRTTVCPIAVGGTSIGKVVVTH